MIINAISAQSPQNKFNKISNSNNSSQNVNFSGLKDDVDKFFSKQADKERTKNILFKIANNKTMEKIVKWASRNDNSKKLAQYLMVGYSAMLQTNHIINIHRNKQMPEERKETLIVNNALAFVIPTIGAFTVDNAIDKGIERFQKYAEKVRNQKFNEHQAEGLKALKTIFIFSMMYKYFATVITTPMADKVTDFMRDKGMIGKNRKAEEAKKESSK